jgi:hypothetical protein
MALQRLGTALTPQRIQGLVAESGSVENGLSRLFALYDQANQNPGGFIQWFAQTRGIDLRQMGQGAPAGDNVQDAQNPWAQDIGQLRSQVGQIGQALNTYFQQQTQTQDAQVQSEIGAFAQDPANPYFNDVREHMGALMKAGKAQTLREAYDMATWAHPSIRKTLLEQQAQAARKAEAERVKAAKIASGSPSGSPAGAKIAKDEPRRSFDEDIAHAVTRALGG